MTTQITQYGHTWQILVTQNDTIVFNDSASSREHAQWKLVGFLMGWDKEPDMYRYCPSCDKMIKL